MAYPLAKVIVTQFQYWLTGIRTVLCNHSES